jgi:hypothetical protein
LINRADIKSAGGVAHRVRTYGVTYGLGNLTFQLPGIAGYGIAIGNSFSNGGAADPFVTNGASSHWVTFGNTKSLGGTLTYYPDRFGTTGSALAQTPLLLKSYTVSTLPAGSIGMEAYVTDATSCTYGGALTGGGTTVCKVFYNGAWVGG